MKNKKKIIAFIVIIIIFISSSVTLLAISNQKSKSDENNIIQEEEIISTDELFTTIKRKGAYKIREIESIFKDEEKTELQYINSQKKENSITDIYIDQEGAEYRFDANNNKFISYFNLQKTMEATSTEEDKDSDQTKENNMKEKAYDYLYRLIERSNEFELTEFDVEEDSGIYNIEFHKVISGYKAGGWLSVKINAAGELCSLYLTQIKDEYNEIKEISVDEEKLNRYIEENKRDSKYDYYSIFDKRFRIDNDNKYFVDYSATFYRKVLFNDEEETIVFADIIEIPYDEVKK